VPVVAFEVLSATASHAARKPAAPADREGSTPFADMLDTTTNKPAAQHPARESAKDTAKETAKGTTKDATKDAAKDSGKDAAKDAAATPQPAPVKAKDGKAAATEAKAKAPETPDTTDVAATEPADDAATETTSDDQNATDAFLTAVADATGVPVAPVDAAKTDAKSDDTGSDDDSDTKSDKADGKDDDTAAVATAVTVPATADTKATPVAAVVTAPAEPAADATPADPAPAAATLTVAAAEQGIVKVAAKTDAAADGQTDVKTDGKTEQKADKPQIATKLDTPPLLAQATTDGKQAASQQGTQPQQAQAQQIQPQQAQPQNHQAAADAAAQPAKATPAHHDAPAPDVASTAKPADTTQPPMSLLQNNGLTAPQNTNQAAAPAPATTPQAAALPVQGIAIEIAGRALDGKKTFDIRLDPPELGKIHVRLDVDHKGEVTSIITADRSDTFDLLRRDAQSLERALQDAGVKTSSNGLQFSLRDNGQQNMPQQFTDTARVVVRDDMVDTEITAPVYRPLAGNRAGLDIRV
jgi:hypothetical protein